MRCPELKLVEVRAGGEGFVTRPCHDDRAYRVVMLRGEETVNEFLPQLQAHGVALLRPIQPHNQYTVVELVLEVVVFLHVVFLM